MERSRCGERVIDCVGDVATARDGSASININDDGTLDADARASVFSRARRQSLAYLRTNALESRVFYTTR
jgi:hypothetical protein